MSSVTVRELARDPAAEADWDAFVDACPEATFFHRAGWRRVIEQSFDQECRFLEARDDATGRLRGILPLAHVKSPLFGNRLVSTGWGVGGGPAVDDDDALHALDVAARDAMNASKAEYVEYRDPARPHADWPRKEGLYATFDRPIAEDEDGRLKQIPRKQRAVLRKALKSDLTCESNDDVDTCWDLYALTMRNHGTPVFSRRYFRLLREVFGDECDVLTVRDASGRPVSSVLNYWFKDRVMPFYTGAVAEARRIGAADLMYFRLMGEARDHGYETFDFGRSKLGTGPYSFKKNWGFEPRPVIHEFCMRDGKPLPDINPANPKYQLMISTWRRLPLPVANTIGPWIGRQVG